MSCFIDLEGGTVQKPSFFQKTWFLRINRIIGGITKDAKRCGIFTNMEKFSNNQNGLRIALPKGSLQSDTLNLFQKAGYEITGYNTTERKYRPTIQNDGQLTVKVSRPQEIPIYVEEGYYDVGITGQDWIRETQAKVEQVLDLEYGWIKIVLAVPSMWDEVQSLKDLVNLPKDKIRISTEYLSISEEYIVQNVQIEPSIITPWRGLNRRRGGSRGDLDIILILSFGATEGKPPDEADAIIDNTSSGRTLADNNLKEIDCLVESTARLIVNPEALKDSWKKGKIEEVAGALGKGMSRRSRESIPAHF